MTAKAARERAIDITHKTLGKDFSRPMFVQILTDKGNAGRLARELVEAITEGIEQDRLDVAKDLKAQGPS